MILDKGVEYTLESKRWEGRGGGGGGTQSLTCKSVRDLRWESIVCQASFSVLSWRRREGDREGSVYFKHTQSTSFGN